MDEFIKLLDPAYELIQYRIKEDKVIFHIASTITELECSFCGRKTSKVHSIYEREIQDLPMQGKKVILLVDTRRACDVFIGSSKSNILGFSMIACAIASLCFIPNE